MVLPAMHAISWSNISQKSKENISSSSHMMLKLTSDYFLASYLKLKNMVTMFVNTENQHFDCFHWQKVTSNLFQWILAMTGAMACNFCQCSYSSMIFFDLQYVYFVGPRMDDEILAYYEFCTPQDR